MADEEEELKYVSFCTTSYERFGDIIFLDATYNTNKYKMPLVFASVIDCEGKNQIIMVAFLNNENIETYSKFFRDFKTMHKKAPSVIITDHDLAITGAIEEVFT